MKLLNSMFKSRCIKIYFLVILIFFLVKNNTFCQPLKDSAYVIVPNNFKMRWMFKKYNGLNFDYKNDTIFFVNTNQQNIAKELGVRPVNRFIFKTKNGIVLARTGWRFEEFTGDYIEYYSNGVIKKIGKYNEDLSSLAKIGNWKYFNKKGSLVKEECFNEKGKLISKSNEHKFKG